MTRDEIFDEMAADKGEMLPQIDHICAMIKLIRPTDGGQVNSNGGIMRFGKSIVLVVWLYSTGLIARSKWIAKWPLLARDDLIETLTSGLDIAKPRTGLGSSVQSNL